VFRVACHVLAYSNSCVNPFIYHYVSADFRRSLASVLAPLLRRCGGRLGRAATTSSAVGIGIELATTHPVESGFIAAGARSAVLGSVVPVPDQDDSYCVGTVSLVAVHGTAPQVYIDTVSPVSINRRSDSSDEVEECRTGSELRSSRPSYSA